MNRLRSNPLPVVQLRDALNAGADALPDAELLDRFTRYADHAAFEALLRRHGPMVFGVCRRTLPGAADADDAFQATFLVFLRKAKTVRGERLGPWLYGVAWRVAQKARARAARLAAYRTEGFDMLPAEEEGRAVPDWQPILDAELNALPAKYRDALILCELQGRSRAEAARELGLREGTLSSRLSRGRDLLRKRLLKHGTLLPAGGLAALFTANGVGRGSVPLALLTKVSELAKGGAAVGAVPVAAARLTDEVLKSMFLTKLRVAGAALVALVVSVVGLGAALPREAPGGEPEQVRAARAGQKEAPAARPADPKPAGPKVPDREALQGLWVLGKVEFGKGANADEARQLNDLVGKTKFLVAGDVWWGMDVGLRAALLPKWGVLDPTKNPKWLDWYDGPVRGEKIDQRFIYELTGDTLRICALSDQSDTSRPAEFATDSDAPLVVLTFRRDKLPPPAGEKALLGSWSGKPVVVESNGGKDRFAHTPAATVFDGFIMLSLPHAHPNERSPNWVGGKYTVDATKNPKWIDVELVGPMGDKDDLTKLYGCYEVRDGRLKMALGGKRATRPLEFKEEGDVLLFDLGPATADAPQRIPAAAPMPKAKPADPADQLIRDGKFGEAEKLLRGRQPGRSGLPLAEDQLLLGVCLLQRSREARAGSGQELRVEAAKALQEAVRLVAEHEKAGKPDTRAARVRSHAEVRLLQLAHFEGQPALVLNLASQLRPRYAGTVDELVILSFVYHAHRQEGDTDKARDTRARMSELFDKLKDRPDALPAGTGEYSRDYWEKVWFTDK